MPNEEWDVFGKAITLYQTQKITRETFCKIWECAQQTKVFLEYCKELEEIYG